MSDDVLMMHQEAPYPAALHDLVENLSYKRGWRFYLSSEDRGQDSAGLTLNIVIQCPNSYRPDKTIGPPQRPLTMTKGLTKKQRKRLGKYILEVARWLELRDWTWDVMHDPLTERHALAKVTPVYGRKRATLEFCPEFADLDPVTQRHVIVHELVHCHIDPACSIMRHGLTKTAIRQRTYDVLWESYTQQVEFATDGLATAMARHLPLPKI